MYLYGTSFFVPINPNRCIIQILTQVAYIKILRIPHHLILKKQLLQFIEPQEPYIFSLCNLDYLLRAVATSTAHATVHPTIGLLPIPKNPIIST